MSEAQPPSAELNREGAQWFARMRGPDTDTLRPEFEVWLAQGAAHRAAYNRAAEIFAMGKLLAEAETPAPAATAPPSRRPARVAALAACALGALAVGGWSALQLTSPPDQLPQQTAKTGPAATFATITGETRAVRLADGSLLALGSDSTVMVEFDQADRRLRLLRGQARFEVAHERRPFVVLAGGGSVTARGTVFEVALTPSGHVDVRLLEGVVDVALPRRERAAALVRQLHQGERIAFEAAASGPALSPAPSPPTGATIRDYQGVTVATLVAEANRGAVRPIRIADRALGEKQVSGRFRVDDTRLLAERLAALFDSKVELSDKREIVLLR